MFRYALVHKWLRVVVLLSVFIVKKHSAVAADDTALKDLPCSPWEINCPAYEMCCVLGEEYCGVNSGSCEKIHWPKENRLEACCDAIENNKTSHYSLLNACYFRFGMEGLMPQCLSLKEPKNDLDKVTCPAAWQTTGFYITLPLSALLLIAIGVLIGRQIRKRHRNRRRAFGNRGVADVERDNKVNTLRNAAANQPLINNGQGNGTNEETSALTLENLGHTAPVTQNVPGTQNGAAFQNGTAFQNGAAFQNGPGLVQRQNSNSNPSSQTTLEVGNLNLSPSDGPRTIHCDQATDHEYPDGIVPSGKEYRE